MSFATRSRRSGLSLMVLGACALVSIATSQPQGGWTVADNTVEEAFTLSDTNPVYEAGFEVAVTSETFSTRREVSRALQVEVELTTLDRDEDGRRPRVHLTLTDDQGEVLDAFTLRGGPEQSEWGNWATLDASALLADCDDTADCRASVLLTIELAGSGKVFGTQYATANLSVFDTDPLTPPAGALVELGRLPEATRE